MFFFMTKTFWVNNYFIDISRNQIEHQQQATPIPPKALKVLEVLASQAGEVVSHEEIMDIVWEHSVVGPNTLQRAIAQLRKAFGDDSKQQAFIKTHAKKGYSLEANVRWEDESVVQPSQVYSEPEKDGKPLILYAAFVSVLLLAYILWPTQPDSYDKLTPLTASDEQEFNAAYSPDGKYLAFNRFAGQCESHLWAKDLSNNQEQRLSIEPGHYSQLSWSADGSQLAFVLQSDCSNKPQEAKQCWQLQTLDFAQAWNGNGENMLRYDCAGTKTTHPTWLNDGRIALLQYPQVDSIEPNLVIYDAVSNEVIDIPYEHSDQIYSMDYSRETGLLATVSLDQNNVNVLRTFKPDGEAHNEVGIVPLESHSVFERYNIKFSPEGSHFLTNVEGQIYRLEMDGQLSLIHPTNYSSLWSPSYHPSQEMLAATYGTKDFDIGYLNLKEEPATFDVFSRSTAAEINAKFQPNGNLIAFISFQTGNRQLWIADGDKTYQLTKFEQGLKTSRYDWSPDGNTLVINVGYQIVLVKLDGSHETIDSPFAINLMMPWTKQDKLLVVDSQGNKNQLFSLDLKSGAFTELKANNVLWAAYTANDQVIYADQQKHFWHLVGDKTQALPKLSKKLEGTYLLLKGDHLYGIDMQFQFWRYSLTEDKLDVVSTLDKDISYVSDMKGDNILASKFIGGRRELVELSR